MIAAQEMACRQAEATAVESTVCFLSALRHIEDCTGKVRTLLDLGCGYGHLVRVADALGTVATGVDNAVCDSDPMPCGSRLLFGDLAVPVPLAPKADLVLCLEVAEHLPPAAADTLCDTLAAKTLDRLLFSAAIPGQGGSGHLNEQPHAYWNHKLTERGLVFDADSTALLREEWSRRAPGAPWYGQNLMVYRRPQ